MELRSSIRSCAQVKVRFVKLARSLRLLFLEQCSHVHPLINWRVIISLIFISIKSGPILKPKEEGIIRDGKYLRPSNDSTPMGAYSSDHNINVRVGELLVYI